VGYRFRRDLQGLESWTLEQDVIVELEALGLSTAFDMLPCRRATAFDPYGRAHIMQSDTPIFYLVERGPGTHSLDTALLGQARALGVTVLFNSCLGSLDAPALLAGGPKAADAIVVGLTLTPTWLTASAHLRRHPRAAGLCLPARHARQGDREELHVQRISAPA
jgi:hypothetical protein